MSKFTKKCMASGRCPTQRPDAIHFFVNFEFFKSLYLLAWLTPNLGILWISVCSFWLCGSIVANPIIYRLVPSPSRFEIRQWISHESQRLELLHVLGHLIIYPPSSNSFTGYLFVTVSFLKFSYWYTKLSMEERLPTSVTYLIPHLWTEIKIVLSTPSGDSKS